MPRPASTSGKRILIIGVAVICAAAAIPLIGPWLKPAEVPDAATHPKDDKEPQQQEISATEEIEQVVATVQAFMTAETHEERASWVVAPEEALPRMIDYYEDRRNPVPAGFEQIAEIAPTAFDGLPIHMVAATSPDSAELFLFSVFRIGDRQLIDWESSVGYGGMNWDLFLREKPTTPIEMRFYLTRGNYYNDAHADDRVWRHFEVRLRHGEEFLDGYAMRNSATGKLLEAIVKPRARQPVRGFVRWDDSQKVLEITRVLHPYWVDVERIRSCQREAD